MADQPQQSSEQTSSYDASSLQVLEGLEAVRKRTGMYIGSTGERGLHHLVWEIVDNAVDEHLAGYADRIEVTILPDNAIRVVDNGRGIPTDVHAKEGISGVELVLTQLHAGGKFGDDVFAELDTGRRERLAELVADAEQVLVTAAVETDVPQTLRERAHHVDVVLGSAEARS